VVGRRDAGGRIERIAVALPDGERGARRLPRGSRRIDALGVRARRARRVGDADRVAVHDAARPLVDPSSSRGVSSDLRDADAAIAAAPRHGHREGGGRRPARVLDARPFDALGGPNPQAFRRAALERALAAPEDVVRAATDDSMLVERLGGTVRVVESTPANFKVTTPHDLEVAGFLLGRRYL
jgi:2-C-methyl-D-erythritol 4-phosphate cytidylyltransferase